jgi:hypothetical protein
VLYAQQYHPAFALPSPTESTRRVEKGGVVPLDFKIRRILLPIAQLAFAIPNYPLFIMEKLTGDSLDLGDTVAVTEDNTDLRRRSTLPGELADLLNDLVGGGLDPRSRSARVGDGGGRNALSLGVKTTHFELVVVGFFVGVDGLRWLSMCKSVEGKVSLDLLGEFEDAKLDCGY